MSANPQPCAYCRQHAALPEFVPFCSERCKMADLGQWLTGGYRLPVASGAELDSQDDESDETPDSYGREQ
ncbi:MAG: DNA gyrase inhibitor YacG [Acidobacteria bacterium]|nr:DNA gyrase inhibitor YacG [Acidobacteriota bacterium]MBP8274540.1 DNA gyrase inhibitor YacG [Acidobacteriota bacterium]